MPASEDDNEHRLGAVELRENLSISEK